MSGVLAIPTLLSPTIDRFWNKVAITADKEKCWIWLGSFRRRGYGRFSVTIDTNIEKSISAHRIAYFLHYKIDPLDKIILHKCDNPSCVNPLHLKIGTNEDNTKDMMDKGRGKEQFGIGVDHSESKLKDADVLEIRRKYALGTVSQKELGSQYNVDNSLISLIINKKRWKHI